MTTLFVSSNMNIGVDPLRASFSSLDLSCEPFDSPVPMSWPWTSPLELPFTWDDAFSATKRLSTQLDAFTFEFPAATRTPSTFQFTLAPNEKDFTDLYIDMKEEKLAVLKELTNLWKHTLPEPSIERPAEANIPPLFPESGSYETISMDELLDIHLQPPDLDDLLECPPVDSPSPFPLSYDDDWKPATPSWTDFGDGLDAVCAVDDDKDGDYKPFGNTFNKNSVKSLQTSVCAEFSEAFLVTPKKSKRKATGTGDDESSPKRQKYDPEVVCRVSGCRHISKTRFECFKHRETHFPGRFQCPACQKVFVRSSSLSRHLKRPRNAACGSFAGPQSSWGIGLVKFALCSPPWLEPGFLDEITEVLV